MDELAAIKAQLLASLNGLASEEGRAALPMLQEIDYRFLLDLTAASPIAPEGAFSPETAAFTEKVLLQAEDAYREYLLQEIGALQKIQNGAEETSFTMPCGITQSFFPVRLHGKPVYCLSTGPLKQEAFDPKQLAALAPPCGLTVEALQILAASVPVYGAATVNQVRGSYRVMARSLEKALAYQIRTRELTRQVVQSERTRSLGTLSSGISHHFNGLLSIILGYSSFVLNRDEHSTESREALEQITEAAQRGRRLTEELLSFAGSESEEEGISHVHDSMENVISLISSQGKAGLNIDKHFEAAEDTVLALPSDIHQIVFNLLTIASESLEPNRRLLARTANIELDPDAGAQRYLRIELITEGYDPQQAASIAKAEKAAAQPEEMRLSSLYGMVRRMEGTVLVSADANAATRIEILLPLTTRLPEAAVPEKKVKPRMVASTIWVVDDDPLFREMCAQVLHEDGHEVVSCEDGKVMLEKWEQTELPPDLVILDFSMPEYNGLELRTWLKKQNAKIPVVLVSGLAPNQPDIKKALKMKKTYFLQKPFSYRELSDIASIAMGETLIGE